MTVLNIFSLDDTEQQNVIACLSEGKHVIGRGGLLKVTDKRVSRKHAVIEVSNDKVTITSAHVNPCFFKAVNGRTLMVITQNQENELNDGDQFSLLPEDYWFKVKIKKEVPEEPHINGKRCLEETRESNNVDSKRLRLSINSNESDEVNIEDGPTISNITENTLDNSSNIDTSHNSQCKQETNSEENNDEESISSLQFQETARIEDIERENASTQVKEEPTDKIELTNDNISIQVADENIKEEPQDSIAGDTPQNANNTADNKANTVIKKANNDNGNRDGATGSADPPTAPTAIRREKCWYGARCFRKNPNHRISFSHPGDQDYDDADADDDSPDCPYGIACYRKNPDHRKEYKHKAGPAPKPNPQVTTTMPSPSPGSPNPTQNNPTNNNKKQPRRKANKKPKPKAADFDSDEDYDYDDPFINDGSSDDFQPSDCGIDSSDSDLGDSQEVDEESQERNRMLREAKKFLKNKTKD